MTSIADRLFDGSYAESELEDALYQAGVTCERMTWDHYDCSLELHGVPESFRLSPVAQKVIHAAGFAKVYVNHVDKWETHYSWPSDFAESEGWRVSYPHKRGEQGAILVEKHVPTWPQEWFDTGYTVVVGPTSKPSDSAVTTTRTNEQA